VVGDEGLTLGVTILCANRSTGLRRRWRTGTAEARWDAATIPFGSDGLPPLASAEGQAIDAELRAKLERHNTECPNCWVIADTVR